MWGSKSGFGLGSAAAHCSNIAHFGLCRRTYSRRSCCCAEQSKREKFCELQKARFPHNLASLMSRTAPIYKTAIFLADF